MTTNTIPMVISPRFGIGSRNTAIWKNPITRMMGSKVRRLSSEAAPNAFSDAT